MLSNCEDVRRPHHPGGNQEANLESISHRYYLREVAFEWELTKETIYLPLGCLQGGSGDTNPCKVTPVILHGVVGYNPV